MNPSKIPQWMPCMQTPKSKGMPPRNKFDISNTACLNIQGIAAQLSFNALTFSIFHSAMKPSQVVPIARSVNSSASMILPAGSSVQIKKEIFVWARTIFQGQNKTVRIVGECTSFKRGNGMLASLQLAKIPRPSQVTCL